MKEIELSKFVIPTMKATELFSEGPQKIKVRITGLPKESNRAQNL
jgi:sulfur relay (sulfurtransferase) DsrC/TusE family protein